MNLAFRRDEMIRALEHEAKGSFSVVHRALAEASREANSKEIDIKAVIAKIHDILRDAEAGEQAETTP